ncbi:MAG: hypothetical protein ACYTEX_28375 [Planctomycetota bacterium]
MKDKAASDEGEVAPEPEPAAVESLRRRVADFEARDQARELLESEGIQPKAARVSALARCSSETERRSLLAEFPKDAGQMTEPRSTQPFREQRDPEWSAPKDAKEMAARLVG